MTTAFKERHDYVVERINRIPGIRWVRLPTDGTFYVFPDVEGMIEILDTVNNDLDLAELLIERSGVALVSGSAFGLVGHVRPLHRYQPGEFGAGPGPH